MPYVAKFTSQAKADIKALPKNVRNSLRKKLEEVVCINPAECSEGLTGPLTAFRSYHCEEHRIVYKVFEDLKLVVIVGVAKKNADHYAEIYRKLEDLAGVGKLADGILKGIRMVASN